MLSVTHKEIQRAGWGFLGSLVCETLCVLLLGFIDTEGMVGRLLFPVFLSSS